VEEAERIQTQVEPDRSEQLRGTRVWRLEQFTGLGFSLRAPRCWRTTARLTSRKHAG
jgi:hypothetical protein